jgi:cytidylate kinase
MKIYLNGKNVESEIRALSIAEKVSDVAAISAIRAFAVEQQQQMGLKKGIVMDGRDIGTVVFPSADLKIFMTASIPIRVDRRYRELVVKNPEITKDWDYQKNVVYITNNELGFDYLRDNMAISVSRKAI